MYWLALGAVLVGAVVVAPTAQAQSCNESIGIHSSYPEDGATGVATNAPLFIYGPALDADDSDVTLVDASGEAVSIDVQATDGGVLVDPFLGLEPSTRYELRVALDAGDEDWSASFTTGTGPAMIVQLRAPDVTVSVIDQNRGSCGVISAICVNGSVSARRTLEVLVGDEVLSLGDGEPAPAYAAGGGNVAANACIEVRVREPGGSVSETTRLCGAQLERFELADDAAAPTSCQAYRPVAASDDDDDDSDSASESGGCALGAAGGSRAASTAGALGLSVAGLFAVRRRRARRENVAYPARQRTFRSTP